MTKKPKKAKTRPAEVEVADTDFTKHVGNVSAQVVTGNIDRLSDSEKELLIWALSLDLKGDMGLKSNAGIYEVQGQYAPLRNNAPAMIRSTAAGGLTEDVGLRCGPIFVTKPKPSKQNYEMGDRMLKAASTDRHARAILDELGAHRQVLWLTYATPSPKGMEAFSDLCSLALRSTAAREACDRENEQRPPGTKAKAVPKFLQDLSARLVEADRLGIGAGGEDLLAMQAIVHECEPKLAAACRAFKSASRRFWTSERAKTNAKDGARG